MSNKFNFFFPVEIEKGKDLDKDGYPKELIIQGVASTNDEDTDGETLEPSGYDLSRFLKYGFLNMEHMAKNNMSNIVGEPIDAYVRENKLFIKGKLYKNNPKAVAIYDTILMLKNAKSDRKVGFSIEGKATLKDPLNPKKILKAMLTHCAVTTSPKNANTWADIVKGQQEKDFVGLEDTNGGQIYLLDITTPKGVRVTVDKEFNIKVDKAITTESARPLIPESLDGKITDLQGGVFRKNIEAIAKYHKTIGFDKESLGKIRKKIKNYF